MYFIKCVAANKAGPASSSLNNTCIGPSPKYNSSETRKLILTIPSGGAGFLGSFQGPIC